MIFNLILRFKNIKGGKYVEKKGISRLVEMTGSFKWLIILACILSVISAIINLGPFIFIYYIVQEILNSVTKGSSLNSELLTKYGLWALLTAVIGFVIYFISLMCSHLTAFNTIYKLKMQLVRKISNLPLGFHNANSSGKLRKIIESDVEQTEVFIAHQMPDLSGSIIMPVAMIILLLSFDWKLGLLSLIPIVIGFIVLFVSTGGKNGQQHLKTYQNSLEDMNNSAVEYVRGISIVKIFGQTIFSFKNFYDSIMRYRDFALKYTLTLQKPFTGFITIINSTFFFLIPVGIIIYSYTKDLQSFVLSFIFYVIFTPAAASILMKLMYTNNFAMQVSESIERIDNILKEKELEEPVNPIRPNEYSINFSNVRFSYSEKGERVLKDINFTAKQGTVTALVGASGSGKTTIANLIPRFFDVDKGEISIGGIDIRNISTEALMDTVSFVFQDVFLFKLSILENICFGCSNATREDALRAAEAAQCMDIIDKLPNGIDTVIGTNSIHLSGGEKQRIALARAILKDSPIIVLDEATAFADPDNESKIQAAFEKLIKNKTVIMIAHRLSTIKNAHNILVINNGEIVESGTHEKLMEEKGQYKNMYDLYSKNIDWNIKKEGE